MGFEWLTPSRIIITGSCFCVLGSLLMIGSGLLLGLGTRKVETEVIRALIVSSDPESEEYKEWADNFYGEDQVPIYREYTFWNLTNPTEFLAGEKPTYEEVGPYIYRENQIRFDINFMDNENQVSYRSYKRYFYEGGSELDPYSDLITIVNPVYAGIVKAVGSESRLLVAGASIVLGEYFQLLTTLYVTAVIDLAIPTPLMLYQQGIVTQINETTQDFVESQREFCQIWANATSIPTDFPFYPPDMLVSQLNPSEITLSSCVALFEAGNQYSLTNSDPTFALTWLSLETDPSETNPAFGLISGLFSLSSQQLRDIISWRQRVKPQFTEAILASYGVDRLSQLGILQWAQGSVTPGIAVLIPTLDLPSTPEFSIWAQENSLPVQNFTLAEAELLLTGPNTILDLTNFVTFATFFSIQDWTSIQATWGLNQAQATSLYQYSTSSTAALLRKQVFPGINGLGGSGLITSNTPDQLLFNWVDPLSLLLDPNSNSGHFFDNATEAEASMYEPDTFYTGRDEIGDINKYILYQDQSEIKDVWTEDIQVNGTDGTQFGPSVGKGDLWVFVPEMLRSAAIKYVGRETVQDIRLHRFEIADVTLEPNPIFYQDINGLANLSILQSGTPVFLSKAAMLDVPPNVRNLINQRAASNEKDDTFLDVEPITGRTMRFHKRLQINLLVDQTITDFDIFFSMAYSGAYHPIVVADETSEITPDLASRFRDKVYGALSRIFVGFVVLITFGALFVVCGVAIGLWGAYKLKKRDYSVLRDSSSVPSSRREENREDEKLL